MGYLSDGKGSTCKIFVEFCESQVVETPFLPPYVTARLQQNFPKNWGLLL